VCNVNSARGALIEKLIARFFVSRSLSVIRFNRRSLFKISNRVGRYCVHVDVSIRCDVGEGGGEAEGRCIRDLRRLCRGTAISERSRLASNENEPTGSVRGNIPRISH